MEYYLSVCSLNGVDLDEMVKNTVSSNKHNQTYWYYMTKTKNTSWIWFSSKHSFIWFMQHFTILPNNFLCNFPVKCWMTQQINDLGLLKCYFKCNHLQGVSVVPNTSTSIWLRFVFMWYSTTQHFYAISTLCLPINEWINERYHMD